MSCSMSGSNNWVFFVCVRVRERERDFSEHRNRKVLDLWHYTQNPAPASLKPLPKLFPGVLSLMSLHFSKYPDIFLVGEHETVTQDQIWRVWWMFQKLNLIFGLAVALQNVRLEVFTATSTKLDVSWGVAPYTRFALNQGSVTHQSAGMNRRRVKFDPTIIVSEESIGVHAFMENIT